MEQMEYEKYNKENLNRFKKACEQVSSHLFIRGIGMYISFAIIFCGLCMEVAEEELCIDHNNFLPIGCGLSMLVTLLYVFSSLDDGYKTKSCFFAGAISFCSFGLLNIYSEKSIFFWIILIFQCLAHILIILNAAQLSKREVLVDIHAIPPFYVYSLDIKNKGEEYGAKIQSPNTTYIYFRLTLYSLVKKEITFDIKFYSPDGLCTGTPSEPTPLGFTYSFTCTLEANKENVVELGGWGSEKKGCRKAGDYRIEVWYRGECLAVKPFTIYP